MVSTRRDRHGSGTLGCLVWVVAFAIGYRKPILHLATGAVCFMWLFEVLGAQPEGETKKRNLGFRQP